MKKILFFLFLSTSLQAQQLIEIKDIECKDTVLITSYARQSNVYTLPLTVKRVFDGIETTKLTWNHILHSSLGIQKDSTNYQNH